MTATAYFSIGLGMRILDIYGIDDEVKYQWIVNGKPEEIGIAKIHYDEENPYFEILGDKYYINEFIRDDI